MSEYTKQMMLFKEISGKKVEVDFDGGDVSSDAGVLFLKETESSIGIINKVAKAIGDKRHQSYVKHKIVHLLTQRVFQIASGYEDGVMNFAMTLFLRCLVTGCQHLTSL